MKVDLSPKPTRRPEEIKEIVAAELARFENLSLVRALRSFLIIPRMEIRSWDWSSENPEFPVWVVAESQRYDYGIVYSENGFGPESPWGLVFLSHTNFGADYCWYSSLESAFSDSRLNEVYREGCNEP